VGAIDAAALGPFKKQPAVKTRKVFSLLVVISLIGIISGQMG